LKISKQLRTDRKAKTVIKADVHKTKVVLTIDKLQLSLSKVETQRVCNTLSTALAIQESNKVDSKPLPSFQQSYQQHFEQSIQKVFVEKPTVELTTMEKKVEICREIYQVIKDKHPDLPKYRKTKIRAWTAKTCSSNHMNGLAHAHKKYKRSRFSHVICLKQKYLLKADFESLCNTMAHEIGHLRIQSCRHCKRWRQAFNTYYDTIKGEMDLLKSTLIQANLLEQNA
jgi:hypothetical protein